tara:strand:+ start:171 stop:407 length:237 start_codon:yes stop_codon:yes gene_type:complete
MPSEIAKKALKANAISEKQYDKLPEKLLDIISVKNLKLQEQARKQAAPGGTKETHKKTGAQAHKKGRPKKGTKVLVGK